MPPRLIAALIPCFKFTAGDGALLVNRATNGLSDFTGKGDAALVGLIRAAHGDVVVVNRFGQLFRHASFWVGGGLPPVE